MNIKERQLSHLSLGDVDTKNGINEVSLATLQFGFANISSGDLSTTEKGVCQEGGANFKRSFLGISSLFTVIYRIDMIIYPFSERSPCSACATAPAATSGACGLLDMETDQLSSKDATRSKCHASSNRCLTSSNKKLLGAPGLTTRSKDATN